MSAHVFVLEEIYETHLESALALLLALAMTAGAFGCGSKKDAEEKSTSESTASEVPQRSRHSR